VVFQSFPQAVFYNRETRLFELRSDAKKRLAREVKNAVRLGKKRNSELYRAVRQNSFSPNPLVPVVDAPTQVQRISTTYTVQVRRIFIPEIKVKLFWGKYWAAEMYCSWLAFFGRGSVVTKGLRDAVSP